jgi:integrase/recombinase XerC
LGIYPVFDVSWPPKNGGTLEKAATMANHASTRTMQPYHRRDEVSLDELERIVI